MSRPIRLWLVLVLVLGGLMVGGTVGFGKGVIVGHDLTCRRLRFDPVASFTGVC